MYIVKKNSGRRRERRGWAGSEWTRIVSVILSQVTGALRVRYTLSYTSDRSLTFHNLKNY